MNLGVLACSIIVPLIVFSINYSIILYMKPSRSTRVQDNTCFAGDDLILFVSTRQTTLDYFYVLNRHIGFGITVLKMTNLDIFGSSR